MSRTTQGSWLKNLIWDVRDCTSYLCLKRIPVRQDFGFHEEESRLGDKRKGKEAGWAGGMTENMPLKQKAAGREEDRR